MKIAFMDYAGIQGTVTDDGTTYQWSYAGTDATIIEILENAETWTGINPDDPEVSEYAESDPALAEENMDGRISPKERGIWLTRVLGEHTRHVTQVE